MAISEDQKLEKSASKWLEKFNSRVGDLTADKLQRREAAFAYLVAIEGWSQKEAFLETHETTSTDANCIDVMASRAANKERVKLEMDRLRREAADEAIKRDEKLKFVENPILANQRIKITLWSIMVDERVSPGDRIRAAALLGKCKNIDSFVDGGTIDSSIPKARFMGSSLSDNPDAAKSQLAETLVRTITQRLSERTIDLTPAEVQGQ